MQMRHDLWKKRTIKHQLENIRNPTEADRQAIEQQLKLKAIIHANLICRTALAGVKITPEMVRLLAKKIDSLKLPTKLQDAESYKVFKRINDVAMSSLKEKAGKDEAAKSLD